MDDSANVVTNAFPHAIIYDQNKVQKTKSVVSLHTHTLCSDQHFSRTHDPMHGSTMKPPIKTNKEDIMSLWFPVGILDIGSSLSDSPPSYEAFALVG